MTRWIKIMAMFVISETQNLCRTADWKLQNAINSNLRLNSNLSTYRYRSGNRGDFPSRRFRFGGLVVGTITAGITIISFDNNLNVIFLAECRFGGNSPHWNFSRLALLWHTLGTWV